MKVLIETITNRKGYKNFKDINCLNDFLNENRKKIRTFKILKETYNATFEDMIQDIIRHSNDLGRMLLCAFFGMTDQSDRYKNLLKASRYTNKIQSLVKVFINL